MACEGVLATRLARGNALALSNQVENNDAQEEVTSTYLIKEKSRTGVEADAAWTGLHLVSVVK